MSHARSLFGNQQASDRSYRASLRDRKQSPNNKRGQQQQQQQQPFSPNLLRQIAAAEAAAAIEFAKKANDDRQYFHGTTATGTGLTRKERRLQREREQQEAEIRATRGQTNKQKTLKARKNQPKSLPPINRDASTNNALAKKSVISNRFNQKSKKPTSILDSVGVGDRFVEAAGEARVDFVVQRLQDGQDVDHVHSVLGYTALHAAADVAGARGGVNLGQLEIVYLLLQAGCRLNIQAKKNGETALHRAAASGRFKVVELLINYGCRTRLRDNNSQIPLQLANMYNRPRCAMLLREFPLVCRRIRVTAVTSRSIAIEWYVSCSVSCSVS